MASAQAQAAIEAEGLEKRHGSRRSVRDLSFSVPVGATLSVFGANGAGKTTLLRMLATIDRPSAGTLRVFGLDPREDGDAIRSRLGLISHEPMLYPDLSAEENLLLFARLYGVPSPAERVARMLDEVRLSHRAHDAVRGFSRGMTQRMSIARALIHDPDLVLLDEPFSGLDASAQAIARRLFLGDAGDAADAGASGDAADGEQAAASDAADAPRPRRRTVVMTSHDLAQGYRAATHVLLLSAGRRVLFAEKEKVSFDELSALFHAHLAKGAGA